MRRGAVDSEAGSFSAQIQRRCVCVVYSVCGARCVWHTVCVCVCMCQGRKVMRAAVDSEAGSFSSLFIALCLRKLSVCFN